MYAESSTPTVPCSVFVCLSISETDVALQRCQKELLHDVMIHVRFKLNKVYTVSIKPLPSWPPSCSSAFSLFVRSFSFVLSLFLFIFIIFFFFYSLCLCPLHFTMFLFLLLFRASWIFAFPPFSKTYKTSSSPKRDFHVRYTLYIVSTRPRPLSFLSFDVVCIFYFVFPLPFLFCLALLIYL